MHCPSVLTRVGMQATSQHVLAGKQQLQMRGTSVSVHALTWCMHLALRLRKA